MERTLRFLFGERCSRLTHAVPQAGARVETAMSSPACASTASYYNNIDAPTLGGASLKVFA
jgi:hypothetical protein